MAKIQEQTITITLSKLVKNSAVEHNMLVSDEILTTIEERSSRASGC